MRRLISDAVQVKAPLSNSVLLNPNIDPDWALRMNLPTDTEVRDALARLTRQILDTVTARTAGQDGWTVGDLDVNLVTLDMGEVALRGSVIIERADA